MKIIDVHNNTTHTNEQGDTITNNTAYGTVTETHDGKVYVGNKKGGWEDYMSDLLL